MPIEIICDLEYQELPDTLSKPPYFGINKSVIENKKLNHYCKIAPSPKQCKNRNAKWWKFTFTKCKKSNSVIKLPKSNEESIF